MNSQSQYYEFGNRKKNPIDVQPVSKKAARKQQKNLNKTLATNKIIEELEQKKTIKKSNKIAKVQEGPQAHLNPKQIKKIDNIKAILQNHKRDTIRKALEKHQYDQDLAMQQLCSIPGDEEEISQVKIEQKQQTLKEKKQKSKKNNSINNDIGYEILNDVYQNNEEIDPYQFEQLFAQITDILKQEQKMQGTDIFQINKFIDDCYLIRNVIWEGQDESQIYIDSNNIVYRETELFLEELIKKRVSLQNKRKQDFPMPGEIHKNESQQKNIVEKIHESYKVDRGKESYFEKSKVPQVNRAENNNNHLSVFSIKNNPKSYDVILQLSKEYNDMGIDNLKIIYHRLEDINLCKQFLNRFYPDRKREIKIQRIQRKFPEQKSYPMNNTKKSIMKEPKKQNDSRSLSAVRQNLDHLFKRRQVWKATRGNTTNIAYRKKLERYVSQDDWQIKQECEIARNKVIEEMIESHPQYIDLHGYRQEQIDDLFDAIYDMIRSQFKKGNSQLETKKQGNTVYCKVKAMTGKGLHSRYNKSILRPALRQWCQSNNVLRQETEDSITVLIEVR